MENKVENFRVVLWADSVGDVRQPREHHLVEEQWLAFADLLLFMCIPVWVCTVCVPCPGRLEEGVGTSGAIVRAAGHGVGNWTWVPWKSS